MNERIAAVGLVAVLAGCAGDRAFDRAFAERDFAAALGSFRRSAELFDRGAPAQSPRPAWGHAEAHAWCGQALCALGRYDEALGEYRRALELAPNFGWVRDALLPALERRLASKSRR